MYRDFVQWRSAFSRTHTIRADRTVKFAIGSTAPPSSCSHHRAPHVSPKIRKAVNFRTAFDQPTQRDAARNHRRTPDEKRPDFTPHPVPRGHAALFCVLTSCIDWLFSLNTPPPANPCILQGFELVGPAGFKPTTS